MAAAGRTRWLDDGSGFDEDASRVTRSRHASQVDAESVVSGQRQAHAHLHVQVGFDERSCDTVSASFARALGAGSVPRTAGGVPNGGRTMTVGGSNFRWSGP